MGCKARVKGKLCSSQFAVSNAPGAFLLTELHILKLLPVMRVITGVVHFCWLALLGGEAHWCYGLTSTHAVMLSSS